MSPTQLRASRALWFSREAYRQRRWRMYLKSRPQGDQARAKWFGLWQEAVKTLRHRDQQIAKSTGNNAFTMDTDNVNVLVEREGMIPYVYNDSQGHATFGVGHLIHLGNYTAADAQKWGTRSRPKFTAAEAMTFFIKTDLPPYEKAVKDAWRGAKLAPTKSRVGACISLIFNIGIGGFRSSTVLKQIQAGNLHGAADAILLWDRPSEIQSRRRGEHQQFLADHGPYRARV